MYKLNLLPRKVLITPEEVIAVGPTELNVAPRLLLNSIQIAEDRFIKPVICKELYDDFRAQKNVVVTSLNQSYLQSFFTDGTTLQVGQMVNAIELVSFTNYATLWTEQLWKLIAECVVYIATPVNFSRFASTGELVNNPKTFSVDGTGTGAGSVSMPELTFKLKKLFEDRIDPLIASTKEYLGCNSAMFPLYNSQQQSYTDNDGVSYQRKTAWVQGLYDKKSGCYNKRRNSFFGEQDRDY